MNNDFMLGGVNVSELLRDTVRDAVKDVIDQNWPKFPVRSEDPPLTRAKKLADGLNFDADVVGRDGWIMRSPEVAREIAKMLSVAEVALDCWRRGGSLFGLTGDEARACKRANDLFFPEDATP